MNNVIPFNTDDEIAQIGQGLLDRTLPKPAWTHSAHFAAALWLLREQPGMDVRRQMPALIRTYNLATGVANTGTSGYHETITQASIRAATAFLAARPAEPLFEVANALMASSFGHPDWLLAHWSRPRLFSVQARLAWCEPDIRSLDF